MSRKHIPDSVTNRLYALSGNQCAYAGCTNAVTEQAGDEVPVTLGQRAHIVGVGRQGPRSQAVSMPDLDGVENLVLFCGPCHTRVDRNPRIYSVEVLAKIKADHEARVATKDVAPSRAELAFETVDLSILPITTLPELIYSAPAKFRTTAEVAERLPRPRGSQVLPFVLSAGQVWAFHDLADPSGPFRRTVDATDSTTWSVEELRAEHRSMYIWLLNSALRRALLRRGVGHDRGHDRYFFLPDHENITRRVAAKSKLGRAQPQKKVVRQQGEISGRLKDVWWHLAAQLRFEEFAPGTWGLTIRPEFHLTTDGTTPLEPAAIGRKITSRKSRMYNEGYFDAVHFLRYFLTDGRTRLRLFVGNQDIVIERDFPSAAASWVKIDDKRFDPVTSIEETEDDLLDAVVDEWEFEEEWDWGAEPSEAEQ